MAISTHYNVVNGKKSVHFRINLEHNIICKQVGLDIYGDITYVSSDVSPYGMMTRL